MKEWAIKTVSKIYAFWTRLYNKGERKKYSNIKLKKYNGLELPEAAWSGYITFKRLVWQEDTAWMLWDVISIPEAVIARGGDDCDGFANLGHSFFGDRITVGKNAYVFQGLASLIFTKFPYHMIAIYKCGMLGKYITISNQFLFYHADLNALVAHYDNRYGKEKLVRYLSMFTINTKGDIYFSHLVDLKKEGVYHG